MNSRSTNTAGPISLVFSMLTCALAFGPEIAFYFQSATANPNNHLGDALVQASPFLLSSCLAPFLSIGAGLMTLFFAFRAMNGGERAMGRISLFTLLILLVFFLQKLRAENANLPPAQDFGPIDKACSAAALSGHPCNPPLGPGEPLKIQEYKPK